LFVKQALQWFDPQAESVVAQQGQPVLNLIFWLREPVQIQTNKIGIHELLLTIIGNGQLICWREGSLT